MNIPRWLLTGVGGVVLAGFVMAVVVPLLTALELSLPRWGLLTVSVAVTAVSVLAVWVIGRKPRGNEAPGRE
jgi:hypothetical protein